MTSEWWTKPTLLVIEDVPRQNAELQELLLTKGIEATFVPLVPTDWRQPLGGVHLPAGTGWDRFDCALVDLQLSGDGESRNGWGLLRGGSDFLPAIRVAAPWLPVMGISEHYLTGAWFMASAGLFAFDSHVPRSLAKSFARGAWFTIFN